MSEQFSNQGPIDYLAEDSVEQAGLSAATTDVVLMQDYVKELNSPTDISDLHKLVEQHDSNHPATDAEIQSFIAKLERYPYRYHLYSLLSQLEALGLLSDTQPTSDLLVRLGQDASLAFATTSIAGVEQNSQTLQVLINGFGLIGVNAPMPLHFTEYVFERKHQHGDKTWLAFINLLQHRLILSFYRAWRQAQSVTSLKQPDSKNFTHYLASLMGLDKVNLTSADESVDYYAKIYYAGLYAGERRSVANLTKILTQYFGVPIYLEQNVGQWLTVPREEQTQLGAKRYHLGQGLICGERLFDINNKFRVIIGPVDLPTYQQFFKQAINTQKLKEWLHLLLGFEFNWDVQLILAQPQVPAFILGQPIQLGLTSWIGAVNRDADDLIMQQQ